jgi:tRNA dimethylallyltransferase
MTGAGRERLIVILGPTAVGKTALSIALAGRLDTDILSGDSMLVYRGFDVGTAKPSLAERSGVRHELIDILEPDCGFSVTDFQQLAAAKITAVNQRGRIPVLAGGTGLYVKSLVEGYVFNALPGDPVYRTHLEQLAAARGKDYVHAMLAEVDPEAAARLHVNDFRRVIRALEVRHREGTAISQEKLADSGDLVYDVYVVGLQRERQQLYARINARVDAMFASGLEDEVRCLLAAGVPRTAQAMKGIGYKETAAFLAGECTRDEAIAKIKQATRHFAKRQLTWYRKMPYIHWYDVDTISQSVLLETVYEDIAGYFARNAK